MKQTTMHKPARKVRRAVELYECESITVDSTTTVMSACGGCHDLSTTHQDKVTSFAGVGASMPGFSATAVINDNGTLSATAQLGAGVVVGTTATSGGGPDIYVVTGGTSLSAGQRSVSSTTSSTYQDNTRTN